MLRLSKTELLSVILISMNSIVITSTVVFNEMREKFEDVSFTPEFEEGSRKSQLTNILDKDMIKVAIYNDNAYWVFDNMVHKARIDKAGRIHDDEAIVVDVFELSEKEVDNLLTIIDSISY